MSYSAHLLPGQVGGEDMEVMRIQEKVAKGQGRKDGIEIPLGVWKAPGFLGKGEPWKPHSVIFWFGGCHISSCWSIMTAGGCPLKGES